MALAKEVLQLQEWTDFSGNIRVHCDELVGTGKNWLAPCRILGMPITDFILLLKNHYGAQISFFKDDIGNVTFVSYKWLDLKKARLFKNMVNAVARTKNITLDSI